MTTPSPGSRRTEVRLDEHVIRIGDDERVPLLSGQIDHWLHPALHWRDILQSVKDSSLPMVSLYVAWNHHLVDGELDFTGRTDPQRDLARFLDLCDEVGLYVFLRPGPWIYTHFKDGGVPIEVSRHHRLSPEFLRETQRFFAEMAPVIVPRLASNGGRIVLCQLDNEIEPLPTMRGAHGGTIIVDDPIGPTYFDQTFGAPLSQDTSWRSWLSNRYPDVSAFATSVGIEAASWDDVDVRNVVEDRFAQAKADVIGYGEWYISRYATAIRDIVRGIGVDVPLALNPLADNEPQNNVEFAQIADLVGGDYWNHSLVPWSYTMKYARSAKHIRSATGTPWSAEYQSITAGELIHVEGVYTPQDARYWSLLGMLLGLKGWNWYVFAERSVLYFAPINNYGGKIPGYFEAFTQMHDEFLELDWPSFERVSDLSLWFSRQDFWQDVQYSGSATRPFYTHTERDSGAWGDWFERLHELDFDIDLYDPEASHNPAPAGRAVLVTAHGRSDESALAQLEELNRNGSPVVFLSTPPESPSGGGFADLPRPVRVEGRHSGLVVRRGGMDDVLATEYVATFDAEELREDVRVVDVLQSTNGPIGYVARGAAGGDVVVLGFAPTKEFLRTILADLGTVPAVHGTVERVLTSLWSRGDDLLIVVVNANEEEADTGVVIDTVRAGIRADGEYTVTRRLTGETDTVTGADITGLRARIPGKSGELIHIRPA